MQVKWSSAVRINRIFIFYDFLFERFSFLFLIFCCVIRILAVSCKMRWNIFQVNAGIMALMTSSSSEWANGKITRKTQQNLQLESCDRNHSFIIRTKVSLWNGTMSTRNEWMRFGIGFVLEKSLISVDEAIWDTGKVSWSLQPDWSGSISESITLRFSRRNNKKMLHVY